MHLFGDMKDLIIYWNERKKINYKKRKRLYHFLMGPYFTKIHQDLE